MLLARTDPEVQRHDLQVTHKLIDPDQEALEELRAATCSSMADDTPDPQALIRLARQTQSSAEHRRKFRYIDFLDAAYWYRTQLKFFAAGATGVYQRLIYGGNQTGKTLATGAEVSWHLTGNHPDWWVGKRFNRPIRYSAVGESGQLVRDTLQKKLCAE
jgi:Terminase large subunit, T4likevirus-type, N-terminal